MSFRRVALGFITMGTAIFVYYLNYIWSYNLLTNTLYNMVVATGDPASIATANQTIFWFNMGTYAILIAITVWAFGTSFIQESDTYYYR